MRVMRCFTYKITCSFFAICLLLWGWDEQQTHRVVTTQGELALLVGLTPIERALFFDFPQPMSALESIISTYHLTSLQQVQDLPRSQRKLWNAAQESPIWKGVVEWCMSAFKAGRFPPAGPIMENICQGQVWRLFTPSLLHKDLFHLLFNMSWLWILGCQIEIRVPPVRFLLLTLLMGVVSNTAQYFMGGPFFLGFSGIVAGFAGFIWMRQKKAPQEGYSLPRPALLFLFYCILAMMAIEAVICIVQILIPFTVPFNIANTAHVAGGAMGLLLGRGAFFARRI